MKNSAKMMLTGILFILSGLFFVGIYDIHFRNEDPSGLILSLILVIAGVSISIIGLLISKRNPEKTQSEEIREAPALPAKPFLTKQILTGIILIISSLFFMGIGMFNSRYSHPGDLTLSLIFTFALFGIGMIVSVAGMFFFKESTEKQMPEPSAVRNAPVLHGKPYFAGIDILKLIAIFFVAGIHTFLYDGFYNVPIRDRSFIVPIAFRWLTFTCVPIFMTATGYLMKNKKLSKGYYLGLTKIVVIYLLISIPCILSDRKYFDTEITPWTILKGYLEYSNAPYGWYVNYYIALFCLIPFLNLAFNGLENKKQRICLVVTITLLTIFARSFFLGFDFSEQSKLFPDYLNGMWPLAFYYTGAFIREYPPKKCLQNKLIILMVLAISLIFITESTYIQSISNFDNNYQMLSWHFNDYGTYPVFIMSVCIFLLLFDITVTNKKIIFVLRQLGNSTFAAYLISYIFDRKAYNDFIARYPVFSGSSWNPEIWQHICQPLLYVFFHALFWGIVIHNCYDLLEFLIKLGVKKIKEREISHASKT